MAARRRDLAVSGRVNVSKHVPMKFTLRELLAQSGHKNPTPADLAQRLADAKIRSEAHAHNMLSLYFYEELQKKKGTAASVAEAEKLAAPAFEEFKKRVNQ